MFFDIIRVNNVNMLSAKDIYNSDSDLHDIVLIPVCVLQFVQYNDIYLASISLYGRGFLILGLPNETSGV